MTDKTGSNDVSNDPPDPPHVGDARHDAQFFHAQTVDDCGPTTVANIVNEVNPNQKTTEFDVVREAMTTPSTVVKGEQMQNFPFTPGSGVPYGDIPALFAKHGVEATYSNDATANRSGANVSDDALTALKVQLAGGHHVIAVVDGYKIWDAAAFKHDGKDTPDNPNPPNHVVTVTQIDDNGYVHLNDTANLHGGADGRSRR